MKTIGASLFLQLSVLERRISNAFWPFYRIPMVWKDETNMLDLGQRSLHFRWSKPTDL